MKKKVLFTALAAVVLLAGCDTPESICRGWTKSSGRADRIQELGYVEAALSSRIPQFSIAPPATLADALDYLERCMNCTCRDGHDGKGRIKIVREIDEEHLAQPVPIIEAIDIRAEDILRLVCETCRCKYEVDASARLITVRAVTGCVLARKVCVVPEDAESNGTDREND